ncbi:MAG: DUF4380 domain-containing protein [Verrucomicrobiales bacterium]|nr:DUF4380 domain-containing protein [Verrucomicrobiales bacterium]
MRIARVRWKDWDALRCVARECEMIVGVSAGPRILSLRHGAGPNLLYHDTTDFRVGDWRLHGGHRFTVAPEGEGTYAPDNAPCAVETRRKVIRVAAPPGENGTRRVLVISAATDGSGFDLRHVLENNGVGSWRGALWGITCVPHAGTVVAPRTHPRLRFWPGAEREHWHLAPRHIAVTPNGARAKAGWHSAAGWLASLQRAATFVIHCPDAPPAHECVDEGCNLEVFTCADYVELETLSGLVTLAPGEHATHLQRWRLLAPKFTPQDWAAIAAQAGCLAPAPDVRYAP